MRPPIVFRCSQQLMVLIVAIAMVMFSTQSVIAAERQYQDPAGRFSFTLADGWVAARSAGSTDGVWVSPDGNAALSIIHESVRNGTTSIAYAESNVPTLVALRDYSELDRRLIPNNTVQQPLIQYAYTDDDGDRLIVVQVFIVAGATGWTLTLVQLSGSDSIGALNAFEAMAGTFVSGTTMVGQSPISTSLPVRPAAGAMMFPPYAGMYSCSTSTGNFAGFFTLNNGGTYIFGPTDERGQYTYTMAGTFAFTTGEYARSYPGHTGTYQSPTQSAPGLIILSTQDGSTITCKLG